MKNKKILSELLSLKKEVQNLQKDISILLERENNINVIDPNSNIFFILTPGRASNHHSIRTIS